MAAATAFQGPKAQAYAKGKGESKVLKVWVGGRVVGHDGGGDMHMSGAASAVVAASVRRHRGVGGGSNHNGGDGVGCETTPAACRDGAVRWAGEVVKHAYGRASDAA